MTPRDPASPPYVIELLTVRAWLLTIAPHLVRRRLRGLHTHAVCAVIDGSRAATWLAHATRWLTGVTPERFDFRLVDVRDEDNLLVRSRIVCQDLGDVQTEVLREPILQQLRAEEAGKSRLPSAVAKAIVTTNQHVRDTIWRALTVIQLCCWRRRTQGGSGPVVLFLERRVWQRAVERYAERFGVSIVAVPPTWSARQWLIAVLGPERIGALQHLQARLVWLMHQRGVETHTLAVGEATRGPRIAVEYYGHLNLDDPELYSDLFFWQRSSLDPRDVLVMFGLAVDPLDEPKHAELSAHGIAAVALRPGANRLPSGPVVPPRDRRVSVMLPRVAQPPTPDERRWLRKQVYQYRSLRAYWAEVFASQGVKVSVSWFKYDSTHCAIGDALKDVGGVNVIYQRACDFHPMPETAMDVDIVFGGSPLFAQIEQGARSVVPYFVATGYLGDHRFSLLRDGALAMRRKLQARGSTKILAYFDENSGEDPRWHSGHAFMRENYAFLLERVLSEPWFGLLIKPKVPSSLRCRLGPVSELLAQAESTGRCIVYEAGKLHGSYPPAAAALAADVAVHGHLCAATAGIEAALAGVPTLLLDREGWGISPLYQLGVGRVVFTEWPALWAACREQWQRPDGVPGFGDWTLMLETLDPFRDGRAAERMGTYLQWLLDGFRAGLPRETVMADAAERYRATWGKDKVTSINPEPTFSPARAADETRRTLEPVASRSGQP